MNPTLDELKAWVGRSETLHDVAHSAPVAALTATLDHPPLALQAGMPLPPLWHWLYFLPMARQSEIGPDGHPRRGGFLPPVPLPRRMWAGSQFEFRAPLRLGDALRRTLDHRRRVRQVRPQRRAGVREGAARAALQRRGRAGAGGVPRHRLPRRAAARRRAAAAAARTRRRSLAARAAARRGAAVPLFGAHLQRPPHPLRPALRDRRSRATRAWWCTAR